MNENVELNEENVERLFYNCIYLEPSYDPNSITSVIGLTGKIDFNSYSIKKYSETITSLFYRLYDFSDERTIGMLFKDEDFINWTDSEYSIERLATMAIANGDIEYIGENNLMNVTDLNKPIFRVKRKNPDYVELNRENLIDIYNDCVITFSKGDEIPMDVKGANADFIFDKNKINKNAGKINSLLRQIGINQGKPFPYSYLGYNIFNDAWTTEMFDYEMIIGLGLATGSITFASPRDTWQELYNIKRPMIVATPPDKKLSDRSIN